MIVLIHYLVFKRPVVVLVIWVIVVCSFAMNGLPLLVDHPKSMPSVADNQKFPISVTVRSRGFRYT